MSEFSFDKKRLAIKRKTSLRILLLFFVDFPNNFENFFSYSLGLIIIALSLFFSSAPPVKRGILVPHLRDGTTFIGVAIIINPAFYVKNC